MSIRDRYEVDARIGVGGMAEVFRGRRIGVNDFARGVAIKRILGGYASSSEFQAMFIAEARITSQLVHPNIVSVLDFDRDEDGRLCLVMELVEGCDLARLAKTGLLPFPIVNHIIVEALSGLGHAHRFAHGSFRGVIHRDISPHNLLISWHGEVKVSDFGLAKAQSGNAATTTTGLKGKPAYMSPEQVNSESLDGRSDLFAIGTILWELLVGRPLFGAEDARATFAAILFGTVPPPSKLRPEVPRDLERVALKLLERDRGARYRTAGDAIGDLLACASAREDGANRLSITLAERFSMPASVLKPRATAGRHRRHPPRSQYVLIISIALALAIVDESALSSRIGRKEKGDPERVTDSAEYVSLAEHTALPPRGPPPLRYTIDLDELPPSCLLLLDWLWRLDATLPPPTYVATRSDTEALHETLSRMITEGAEISQLDVVCRDKSSSLRDDATYPNPPLPFLGGRAAQALDFDGTAYWSTFRGMMLSRGQADPEDP